MKRFLYGGIAAVLACCTCSATARVAAGVPAEAPDSVAPADVIPIDSLWEEATANGRLDFEVFGRIARDDARFERLRARFESADTTLLFSDRMILYFGVVYRDEYEGGYTISNGISELVDSLPDRAYAICLEKLRIMPSSTRLLYYARRAGRLCGRPKSELDRLNWRYWKTLTLINSLGRGTRTEPFVVVAVNDEYELMYSWLEVKKVIEQRLVDEGGVLCDVMTIEPVDNDYFKGSEVWFDVSFPFPLTIRPRYWAKKLTGEDEEN